MNIPVKQKGLVHYIDVRYVHLKTKDRKSPIIIFIDHDNYFLDIAGGLVMIPSSVVYTNPFTVFPADDEANAGFIDMTKPPASDATKSVESPPSSSASPIISTKEKSLKMNFDAEPAGSFKKPPFHKNL